MNNLIDLEKKINSELTTKINSTEIKHNQIYLETDKDDLIDIVLFLKTNLRSLDFFGRLCRLMHQLFSACS